MIGARQRASVTRSITLPYEDDPRPALHLLLLAIAVGIALCLVLLLPATSRAATKTPSLGAVPKTVHSTTGPKPPKNVRFKVKSVGGATGPLATYAGGLGETLIPGVPAYAWRDGCGPTAVGMVVGYYDGLGWDELVTGDALLATAEASQMIASHSVAGEPRHYEDYSLPKETGSTALPDKSEAPSGDEHGADSVADFMHTSWSVEGMLYGWSWSNKVGPAFTGYVTLHYPSSAPACTTRTGSSLTWDLVKGEVDAGRPMVFLVDSSGDGQTDHFVTVIGYRELNGYPEYACWDTWSTTVVRWARFRSMSASYAWGVWGGFTISLPGAPPDTNAPVTVADGADGNWRTRTATVTFSAADDGSGVAYTEYRVDGGSWTQGTSATVTAPRKRPTARLHLVEYRSADLAGNVEATKSGEVRLDTIKPVTQSSADSIPHAGPYVVTFTATDVGSGVAGIWCSVDGNAFVRTSDVTLDTQGAHTLRFYASDIAGNRETVKSVAVTIE